MTRPKRHPLKQKLLLSCAVFVLLVVGSEGFLRLLGIDRNPFRELQLGIIDKEIAQYDERLFWRCYKKDRLGANYDEWVEKRGEREAFTIFCLTDSVGTFNHNRGYPDVLADMLKRAAPARHPLALNFSCPGYSTFQGLRFFRDELLQFRPDVVIVCFGWNDHWNSYNGLEDKAQAPLPVNGLTRMLQRSRLCGFLGYLTMKHKKKSYSPYSSDSIIRVARADYRQNLEAFAAVAHENGVHLILMTTPYLDVGRVPWAPLHRTYNDIVREVARLHNVTLIDQAETFVNRADLFVAPETDQIHYNMAGAELIAAEVRDVVLRNFM